MESTATARDRPWTPGRRRLRVRLLALALMATLTAGAAAGASLRVAVTVDDLPWSGPPPQGETRLEALRRITAVLRVHGAPATGFVICDHATADDPVLRMWAAWRLQLANHSAAHRDLDRTPVEEWLADVARCDAFLRELGVRSPFFRYPMLHEGAEAERRAAARAGIAELGLRSAPVTVDSSEWLLAAAYRTALARGDAPARSALARTFVDHLGAALGHAEAVARRKLGRTLPHVLLLHANALVADHLDLLLLELERRGVRFVSLEEALADPAYARPDGYLGPQGLSWLYRMQPASPEDAAWDEAAEAEIRKRFATLLAEEPPPPASPGLGAAPLVPPALEAAVAMAATSERMRSLLVMHRGRLVVEAYFNGADAERPMNLKSATKSLTSALVGVALDRGWIRSLDDPLSRYLPGLFADGRHPGKAAITLRHLLTMRTGLEPVGYDAFQHAADPLGMLISAPFAHPPGTTFAYDTPPLDLLTAVLERVSGEGAEEVTDRELLGPLGAKLAYWRRDAAGVAMGGNDAYLRPRDLIRLGELFRRGGVWEGRRVLSEGYVREAVEPLVHLSEPTVNHGTLPARGYGLLWWALEVEDDDVFAALGHGGQELLVFPRRELVVLMTSRWPGPSSSEHYRHLVEVLRQGVLPAFPPSARAPAAR